MSESVESENQSQHGDDYHREVLHCAEGVDLVIKTKEPTDIDLNERFRDSGDIDTEDLSHVCFEVVMRE